MKVIPSFLILLSIFFTSCSKEKKSSDTANLLQHTWTLKSAFDSIYYTPDWLGQPIPEYFPVSKSDSVSFDSDNYERIYWFDGFSYGTFGYAESPEQISPYTIINNSTITMQNSDGTDTVHIAFISSNMLVLKWGHEFSIGKQYLVDTLIR